MVTACGAISWWPEPRVSLLTPVDKAFGEILWWREPRV